MRARGRGAGPAATWRALRAVASRALAACALLVPPLSAQGLRVRLLDATTGTPIVGAIVTALDDRGRPVVEGLTDASGVRALKLSAGASYRLRVRRVGIVPFTGAPLAVEGTALRDVVVELASTRQALATVRVTADAVCGRSPEGDTRLASLFEELRTALEATALARADTTQAMTIVSREYERDYGRELSFVAERITRDGRGLGQRFAAADVSRLAQDGFVVQEPDRGFRFFAPDEIVLMSDAFIATHCFSAPPPDSLATADAELRFRLAPGRKRPDIEGTAFIDTLTGEPRRITYHYVFPRRLLPAAPLPNVLGGEVVLERLRDGQWFVPRWHIRMPLFGETDGGTKVIVSGYRETGGEAAPIDVARSRFGTVLPSVRGVTLVATVRDDVGMPVQDATVDIDSGRVTVRTDTAGVARLLLVDTQTVALRVRRIGVQPVDTVVRIGAPGVVPLAFTTRRVQALAAVAVVGRTMLEQVGYVSRRRLGSGVFLDSTDIRRRNALDGLSILFGMPGIIVFRVPSDVAPPRDDPEFFYQWVPGQTIPVMRASSNLPQGSRVCLPNLVVNGRRSTPAELQALPAEDITAMEVYRLPTQVPAEYRRMKLYDVCGAVLVWTTRQR
jgi:hypothetical protein